MFHISTSLLTNFGVLYIVPRPSLLIHYSLKSVKILKTIRSIVKWTALRDINVLLTGGCGATVVVVRSSGRLQRDSQSRRVSNLRKMYVINAHIPSSTI